MAEKCDYYERRRKLLALHVSGAASHGNLEVLAGEYGLTFDGLCTDWANRRNWIGCFFENGEFNELVVDVVVAYDALIDECWDVVRTCKAKDKGQGYWAAVNKALENCRETITEKASFLQSVGRIPKEAGKIEQEVKTFNVTESLDEHEQRVVNEAARILDQKHSSKEQPRNLH
jgi:hypothetical protein